MDEKQVKKKTQKQGGCEASKKKHEMNANQ